MWTRSQTRSRAERAIRDLDYATRNVIILKQPENIFSKKYGLFLIKYNDLDVISAEFDDFEIRSERHLMDDVKSFLGHAIDMGVSKIQHGYLVITLPTRESFDGSYSSRWITYKSC